MKDDKKKDRLGKYNEKSTYPPLEKMEKSPQLIKEEVDYLAIEESGRNRSPRFKVCTADGKSYGCSFAHLLDWVYEPPALLTINTVTKTFVIKGKNLNHLERLLMDEKIKSLNEFNAKNHKPPPSNKTLIEEIEVITSE